KGGGAEQGGGLPIEIYGGVGMVAQNRGGRHRTDRSIETGLDGRGLARAGNHSENFLGLENLAYGHGDGMLRNSVETLEPPVGELLRAAGVVKGNNDVGFFRGEIGRRIVERNM